MPTSHDVSQSIEPMPALFIDLSPEPEQRLASEPSEGSITLCDPDFFSTATSKKAFSGLRGRRNSDENMLLGATQEKPEEHADVVLAILSQRTAVVHLVVGKNRTKLTCHRVLLTFYSKYFEIFFSGESTHEESIDLPHFNAHSMKGFIAWVYSGVVDVKMQSLCQLWALGRRLLAPKFQTGVMRSLFIFISVKKPSPDIAEEIYEMTSPGSKLRNFCADVIAAEGPFSYMYRGSPTELENWKRLIKKGGDLALDQAERVGWRGMFVHQPYHHSNQSKYIEADFRKLDLKSWRTDRE